MQKAQPRAAFCILRQHQRAAALPVQDQLLWHVSNNCISWQAISCQNSFLT